MSSQARSSSWAAVEQLSAACHVSIVFLSAWIVTQEHKVTHVPHNGGMSDASVLPLHFHRDRATMRPVQHPLDLPLAFALRGRKIVSTRRGAEAQMRS